MNPYQLKRTKPNRTIYHKFIGYEVHIFVIDQFPLIGLKHSLELIPS